MEVLLATLVSRADEVISNDRLCNELWGAEPPRRAQATLHVYVSQLRKFLGGPEQGRRRLVTRSPGYLLAVGPDDEVDVREFQHRLDVGREALGSGCNGEAAEALDEAIASWRGPALGELQAGPLVNEFVRWAEEAQLECAELRVEAYLKLGRHRQMIGPLRNMVTENPMRETLARQLMIALYRSERQGDALKVYRFVRDTLARELGVEPGGALQDLQQAILQADDHRLDQEFVLSLAC